MFKASYYEVGDLMIVQVEGRISPDQNKPFRDICEKNLKNRKVIFCLENLNFTASANISTFFESINLIPDAKVVGLKNDFFRLLELKGMDQTNRAFKTLSEALRNFEF
jgi:anti-anti-sigma regulatory factor